MTLNWQLVPFTNLLSGFQLLIVFLWKRFLKLPMVNQIFPSKSNIYEKYTWHYKELQLFVRFSLLFANSFGKEIRKRDTRRSTLESSHSNSPKTEYSGKKTESIKLFSDWVEQRYEMSWSYYSTYRWWDVLFVRFASKYNVYE